MSIIDNKEEYNEALEKAHKEFPLPKMYPLNKENCRHKYGFTVYCDREYDIRRCLRCGNEKTFRCNFSG